ncbi:DUF4007 family protein [Kordiimonas aquimaris]|uniref:DUF4007 family protein n=1 Tax=Kordiimonas aquimaris TaxID=707591 RepID=UPI0021D1203A|nr:DUF4007 family protein [Kordiimonas aquimaris]
MKTKLTDANYKPQFAGHETFYLRYGWLKKAADEVKNAHGNTRKVFTDDDAIASFGVGKNMVSAIRFWAHACDIIHTQDSETMVSELGSFLLAEKGADPYLENPTSLWILHWKLASNPKHTSIYWLFNYFTEGGFDKNLLMKALFDVADQYGWKKPNEKTLSNDLLVFLNTYAMDSSPKKGAREDNLTSPLAELGLVRSGSNGRFHMGWGPKPSLGKGAFLYALCDFWEEYSDANTLNFQNVLLEPGSPGRIFLMDENDLAVRLMEISDDTNGLISWSETAGLKQLIRSKSFSEKIKNDFLTQDYATVQHNVEAA